MGLLALYLIVWRPARALCTKHVTYFLLSSVETERAGNFEHTNGVPCVSIFVPLALTWALPTTTRWRAATFFSRPFFSPSCFPYWLYRLCLWGLHQALETPGLGLLCLGIADSGAGFVLYDMLTQSLVDAFSLGVAARAVVELGSTPQSWMYSD